MINLQFDKLLNFYSVSMPNILFEVEATYEKSSVFLLERLSRSYELPIIELFRFLRPHSVSESA